MKKRIEWIDSLKGLAIILVVIGHVADGYLSSNIFNSYSNILFWIYNIIYSFHMPLFFIISGVLFGIAYINNGQIKYDKVKKQIYNLIFLYFIFSICQWGIKFFLSSGVNNAVTLKDLILLPIKPMTPYWYIYDLVIFYFVYIILDKFTKTNRKYRKYILYILVLILFIITGITTSSFAMSLYNKIKYFLLFLVGVNYIKIFDLSFKKSKKLYIILDFILLCLIITLTYLKIDVFRVNYLNFIVGLLFGLIIVYYFYINKITNMILNFIGKFSTEIYLIHCYFTFANRIILLKMGVTNFYINFILNVIISTFLSILSSIILKKLKLYDLIFNPFKMYKKGEIYEKNSNV